MVSVKLTKIMTGVSSAVRRMTFEKSHDLISIIIRSCDQRRYAEAGSFPHAKTSAPCANTSLRISLVTAVEILAQQ